MIQIFFQQNNQSVQICIFSFVFLVCWNTESFFGVSKNYNKWRHLLNNVLVAIPGAIVQFFVAIFFIKILIFENSSNIGILPYLNIKGKLSQTITTFIILDFIYWTYHFIMHKFKILWRFHSVHHSDIVLNVSTSLREHPFETLIRLSFYILAVSILGPALWIVSLHQFVQIVSKIIIHGNFRLPEKTDKVLSMLLLTPNMHHVHHHHEQPYTDSNFGDLMSIWDRLFGTFRKLTQNEVRFGLDVEAYNRENHKNLKWNNLLKIPFKNENLSN